MFEAGPPKEIKRPPNKCLYCDQELSGRFNIHFFKNVFNDKSGMICRDCLEDIKSKR